MRIAFDHQILGAQEYGGVSRYLYELAVELATTYEQDVAVISPVYVNRYLVNAPKELKVLGSSVPRLKNTWRLYQTINSVLSWPAIRFFNPNIIHETYYSPIRMGSKNTKVVLTVYDMIHEKFNYLYPNNDLTSYNKALAVERADHIICISAKTKEDLIQILKINPNKVSVVHLGFTLSNQMNSNQSKIKDKKPFLLYVGNRGGYKNFRKLLEAYATSNYLKKNFQIVCFGGGDFSQQEKEFLIQLKINLDSIIQINGDDVLLAEYYRVASAFIYPSLYEGFGIPPLEAMSFDCPVVCSGVSSIPEVVGNAAELFDPYDVDSIRIAIERVISNNVLREVLIARGRERIKVFSWQRCARETLAIYQKVMQ